MLLALPGRAGMLSRSHLRADLLLEPAPVAGEPPFEPHLAQRAGERTVAVTVEGLFDRPDIRTRERSWP